VIWADEPERREQLLEQWSHRAGWVGVAGVDAQAAAIGTATLDAPAFPGAVLPRFQNGAVRYYALAEHGPAWRTLAPYLRAFLGSTVTDFDGLAAALDSGDAFERWLAGLGLAAVGRLRVGSGRRRPEIAVAGLTRLHESLTRAARPERAMPQTVNGLLYAFRMATAVMDRARAETALDELRSGLHLDALNLRFLQVALDGAMGDWEQLVQRDFFQDLVDTRRPPRVTATMIEALYRAIVQPVLTTDGPAAALDAFLQRIHGRSGTLLRTLPHAPTPAVAQLFLLAELAVEAPNVDVIDALRATSVEWPDNDAAEFASLLTLAPTDPEGPVDLPAVPLVPETAPTTATAAAPTSALTAGQQLEAARDPSLPALLTRAQAVLVAANDLGTVEAYGEALAYVERLSADEQDTLLASRTYSNIWEEADRLCTSRTVPRSWTEWIMLTPQMSPAQARALAAAAVNEWPPEEQVADDTAVTALVAAIAAPPTAGAGLVEEALPDLVAWLQVDPDWPTLRHRELYEAILVMLLAGTSQPETSLTAARFLLDALLRLGLPAARYAETLDFFGDVVKQLGTQDVDWMLDVVESTVAFNCPDEEARMRLWVHAAGRLKTYATRIEPHQRSVAADLAQLLGAPDPLGPATVTSVGAPAPRFDGLRIAIYTLTTAVGRRVAQAIKVLHPGIRVDVSDDKVSTPQLVDLAQAADLFVICWRSAKHAATDAIRARRPAHLPLVYALGKGSSSIIAEIEQQLRARLPQ
jgi:hypothetical protein